MKLNSRGLADRAQWEAAGFRLPEFDREAVTAATRENPFWIHFGAGNIFRAFQANVVQNLLNEGVLDRGLIVAEGFDYEIIRKMNRPHDDYSVLVTLKGDGSIEKTVVGSVVESCILDSEDAEEYGRLKEIFGKDSLQMVSFTITEKGYSLVNGRGELLPEVKADFEAGPEKPASYIGKVASLLYSRYLAGEKPLAMVSMDNCSHNGDKLYAAVNAFAEKWTEKGKVEPGFADYINNREKVTFPWTMIDKITPRPDASVEEILKKDGLEETESVVTAKNTYVAPFVNAEECEYLVIEDAFPNGRPELEKGGLIFTGRETVDKVERMKVCTCLNPLHTTLAVYGCLLGYKKISEEMKDVQLKEMVKTIGYTEGLPVVTDPGVLDPKEFIDTVVNLRIPNPFMPDTPQRIATDTSQKLAIRFGETIKAYMASPDLKVADLKLIPLVFAGWLRYLMGVDDQGQAFELSPDPLLETVTPYVAGFKLGETKEPAETEKVLRPVLEKAEIFGVNLYEAGMAEQVCGYFAELTAGVGAVRRTLEKYVTQAGGPKAPKDPVKKPAGFYIMRNKEIDGSIQPDGRGIQFLYMDGGRMISSARIVGNVKDEGMLELLKTTAGFRKLVSAIGVTVEMEDGSENVDFVLQMYGKKDPYVSGTQIKVPVSADGAERIVRLSECRWSEDDDVPGQIRFEFARPGEPARVSVKLYLQEGFEAPEEIEELPVNLETEDYRKLLKKSLMQTGNTARLKKAIDRARQGEEVTIAFIGGSITQGAGAVPINTGCYAYKTFQRFCALAGRGTEENIHFVKAGVGGTPSELGMLRYERDVLRDGSVEPDIVVVEFAVNDEGDETKGECYDSLVRKILKAKNCPAVILLFAVFENDWNLQERLSPVGKAYDLPMVSVRDAVVEQFYQKPDTGKVFSKPQFFYDCYHPTNLGHTVMADCIGYLLETVDQQPAQEDTLRLEQVAAPIGGEFEDVKLFDRNSGASEIRVDCGDFFHMDEELQGVEMDMNLAPTKEFPHNWMRRTSQENAGKPFSLDITCTALLLIYKDSGSSSVGRASVTVDGKKVLEADPHVNGWTHCNPVICFRNAEKKQYHVEVSMLPGDEDKEFTILGFGYVE